MEIKNKNSNHVNVVLINEDGLICLVSRKDDHTDFGFIGGKLDGNETYEDAAIRETKEETGLNIINLKMVFAMHRNGCMGKTFIGEYSGEINYDTEKEPHIVKWGEISEAIDGKFGYWNGLVKETLESLELKFR